MFWTKEHDVILLRGCELKPVQNKKGIYAKKYDVGKSGRGIK